MKLLRIIGHPYTLVISFLFLLISGESFGGFYSIYLLMALPHGSLHAVLGTVGTALVLLSSLRRVAPYASVSFNTAGILCMIGSLFNFFDRSSYNMATFQQTVPILTFLIFGVCILCSAISRIASILQDKRTFNS